MNEPYQTLLGAPLGRVRRGTLKTKSASASPGEIRIDDSRLTLGRDSSCDVVINDRKVSSIHASLEPGPRGIELRDLGSLNGTSVGGALIREATLASRVEFSLGGVPFVFEPDAPDTSPPAPPFGRLRSMNAAMQIVLSRLARAAVTELSVLLLGETGTGKEVVARTLHETSARASRPFVVVDCGAIPHGLAEAALFGHEKGAFTGAISKQPSPFLEANGGTVFLDELGELPIDLQPKLLRALAEKRIKPVGGTTYAPFDARVVAATRRDLPRAVNDGSFRSDLYFRLAQLSVTLPPLRDRVEDIPELVAVMLGELGQPEAATHVTPDTYERLMQHDWPGNIRELRNAVTAALALSEAGKLPIAEFVNQLHTSPGENTSTTYHEAKKQALERFERVYFAAVLREVGTNISEMARRVGLERTHVRRYLRRHNLLPGGADGGD